MYVKECQLLHYTVFRSHKAITFNFLAQTIVKTGKADFILIIYHNIGLNSEYVQWYEIWYYFQYNLEFLFGIVMFVLYYEWPKKWMHGNSTQRLMIDCVTYCNKCLYGIHQP